jgi:hypothetical protein
LRNALICGFKPKGVKMKWLYIVTWVNPPGFKDGFYSRLADSQRGAFLAAAEYASRMPEAIVTVIEITR